jgi:acetolactate synthase-1/2/3 large subunit
MLNAFNYLRGRPAAVGIWHTVGSLLLHPALMDARSSRIPVVHIGLNGESRFNGRDGAIQQVPIDTFAAVSRYVQRVERIDKLGEAVHKAFQATEGVPSGPAYLDIPFDLTVNRSEFALPREWEAPHRNFRADPADVAEAAKQLLAAERPVIVVGGGAVISDAGEDVRALAELAGVPVVTTTTAQGILSEEHPLSLGTAGMAGWSCANETLAEADFALIIGSRLSDWGLAQGFTAKLPARIVQVDSDPAQLGEFYFPRLPIVADAKAFVGQLIAELPSADGFEAVPFEDREIVKRATERKQARLSWLEEEGDSDRFPAGKWRIMKELRGLLAPEDILVSDIGGHSVPVMSGAIMRRPKRMLVSFGEGVLGSALPMGIGAKLAEPGSKVVVGSGDGALQYHFNELRVAIAEELPMVVVVFNNESYAANDGMMEAWYGTPHWTRFRNPDWVMLAKAYGADGEKIGKTEDIGAALERGFESKLPYVIDVPVDRAEGFPENATSGPMMLIKGREIPVDSDGSILAGEHLVGSR